MIVQILQDVMDVFFSTGNALSGSIRKDLVQPLSDSAIP